MNGILCGINFWVTIGQLPLNPFAASVFLWRLNVNVNPQKIIYFNECWQQLNIFFFYIPRLDMHWHWQWAPFSVGHSGNIHFGLKYQELIYFKDLKNRIFRIFFRGRYLIANCNGQIPCSDLTRNYNSSRIYCADHFLWKGNEKSWKLYLFIDIKQS